MKTFVITATMLLASILANAQLKGSGKTLTKNFNYSNFDKVYFEDIDGKLEVEIGKTWSITVTIDDNLEPLLTFEENTLEHELKVFLRGNKNNKMYIEDTHIKVKITMPEASVIRNDSNANLVVSGVNGRYFRLENLDNATTTVSGNVDELDIENKGNGNANLLELTAKKAKITCRGNGNVSVNVDDEIEGIVSGNGNINNKGKARFGKNSSRTGNGNLINS